MDELPVRHPCPDRLTADPALHLLRADGTATSNLVLRPTADPQGFHLLRVIVVPLVGDLLRKVAIGEGHFLPAQRDHEDGAYTLCRLGPRRSVGVRPAVRHRAGTLMRNLAHPVRGVRRPGEAKGPGQRRRRIHGPLDRGQYLAVQGVEQMAVPVHGGGDRLVAQPGLDRRQRHLRRDQPRSVRVTKIVDARPLRQAELLRRPLDRRHPPQAPERSGIPPAALRAGEQQIVRRLALRPAPQHPLQPARDHDGAAALLRLRRTQVRPAVLVPLPGPLDADRGQAVTTAEVAGLQRGDLAPAGAGLRQGLGQIPCVLRQAPVDPGELLPLEEDHLLLDLLTVQTRQTREVTRIGRAQRRLGVHGGLQDGVQQTVLVGDGLRLVLRPRPAVLRIVRSRPAGRQVVDPPLDHLACDAALAVAHRVALEPRRHVLLHQPPVLRPGVPLHTGQQLDLLHGERLEHLLRAAQVRDEALATDPARRPLLTVPLHQVPEPLGGLPVVEDLRLPLAGAGPVCAPADDVADLSVLPLLDLDVRHGQDRNRTDVPTPCPSEAAQKPLRPTFPQVRGASRPWSLGESNP